MNLLTLGFLSFVHGLVVQRSAAVGFPRFQFLDIGSILEVS